MLAALEAARVGTAAARDAFELALSAALPEREFVGRDAERLWNTSAVRLPDFENVRWIRALEQRGFLISTGSACASGKLAASPARRQWTTALTPLAGSCASRSAETTPLAWEGLCEALIESHAALRNRARIRSFRFRDFNMRFSTVRLQDFRNIEFVELDLSAERVFLCGSTGRGNQIY